MHQWSQLLGRLRPENCLNLGGRVCSELRSHHRTSAWAIERDSVSNKNKTKKSAGVGEIGGRENIIKD